LSTAELDSFSRKRPQLIDPEELVRESESRSEGASVVQTLPSLPCALRRKVRRRLKASPMVTDHADSVPNALPISERYSLSERERMMLESTSSRGRLRRKTKLSTRLLASSAS